MTMNRWRRGRLRANPLARHVTADEFGDDWPLTVDAGWIRFDPTTEAVVFVDETDGAEYGLNGTACALLALPSIIMLQQARTDLPEIPNPDGEDVPVRKSVGMLIDAAPGRRR